MSRDWHPADIKSAVQKRGSSLSAIARAAGIAPNALGHALRLPRAEAEGCIAAALDLHPMDIWPSRYHPDGRRKRPQPVDNYRFTPCSGNHEVEHLSQLGAAQ